jgi:hypothetical protein
MVRKKKAELENIPSKGWPKINQGSHLTVKTFEDGSTELIWDDEALTRDVRNAILSVENSIPVSTEKPKRKRKANGNT